MIIKNILLFVKNLKTLKDSRKLASNDIHLYSNLKMRFSAKSTDYVLSDSDFNFLLKCFKKRWENILDTSNDYMQNGGVVNQKWIEFAKDLAPFTAKSYLQILMPSVINTHDYNNLSPLTETVRFENFYLGQGDTTLYRKRGLCEHLIEKNFILSTFRNFKTSKLNAVSVVELTRLQSCRQTNNVFSIGEEQFTNFWDFLRKKVFTRLQSRGHLPVELLPHLVNLIEEYYRLKTTGDKFETFKLAAQLFFTYVSKNQLDDINYFYGIKIPYKGRSFYLLDYLVVINKARSYDLDEQLNALAVWLYQFNPILKATSAELTPVYEGLTSSHDIPRFKNGKDGSLNQCLHMLLSLFTTDFDFLPFSGADLYLWDKAHAVAPELGDIYVLFESLLINNQIVDLPALYQRVLRDIIRPARADLSLYTWFTRFNSVAVWYDHVATNSFNMLNVYWFQPELLMHVFSEFKCHDPFVACHVNLFLDELIHTYTQHNYELMKQFRVNILFADLMKKLPAQYSQHLLRLVQLYNVDEAKMNFLNNCIGHIINRLTEIKIPTTGGSLHFFTGTRQLDISKLKLSPMCFEQLDLFVDTFKAQLHTLNLNKDLSLAMMEYLRALSLPILTVREQQATNNSLSTLGYIGAPNS